MSTHALPTDLHWADLHVRTLCKHAASGRLLRWNEPGRDAAPAPLFFFAATLHGNLWRFHEVLEAHVVRDLARLAAAERTQTKLAGDPERLASFEQHLQSQRSGLQVWRGFAFRFPGTLPSSEDPLLPEDQYAVLGDAFSQLRGSTAERLPSCVHWDGSDIVSACYSATASGDETGVEAGVETLASHRGQALAVGTVAGWAREIARRGRIPLYSTARENRSSQALARKLGLELYASTLHFRETGS